MFIKNSLDSIAYNIQVATIVGIILSGFLDRAYVLFGMLYTIPLSLILLIYFFFRWRLNGKPKVLAKGLLVSFVWLALNLLFFGWIAYNFSFTIM
jgi:hypothetical protein